MKYGNVLGFIVASVFILLTVYVANETPFVNEEDGPTYNKEENRPTNPDKDEEIFHSIQTELQGLKKEVVTINLNINALRGKIENQQRFLPQEETTEQLTEMPESSLLNEKVENLSSDAIKWQTDLSPELKQKVDDVFSYHHQKVKSQLESEFGTLDPNNPIPPDKLEQFMNDDQQELFADMKAILPEKEFKQFVSSLPKL